MEGRKSFSLTTPSRDLCPNPLSLQPVRFPTGHEGGDGERAASGRGIVGNDVRLDSDRLQVELAQRLQLAAQRHL